MEDNTPYWHTSSVFEYNRQILDEEEDAYTVLNLMHRYESKGLEDNSKRVMFAAGGTAILLLVAVVSSYLIFWLLTIAGAVVTYYFFAVDRPKHVIVSASRVYWPFAMIVRPDSKRVFFDVTRELGQVHFAQFGYPLKAWEYLAETLEGDSDKDTERTLENLDTTLVTLSADYVLPEDLPVMNSGDNVLKDTFFSQNPYPKFIDRSVKPSGLLVDVPISDWKRTVNEMNTLDKYSASVLQASALLKRKVAVLGQKMVRKIYGKIEELFEETHQRRELLETSAKEVFSIFQPVRNLIRRQYEPQKILFETILTLTNAQIDMSQFLYTEQQRVTRTKEDIHEIQEAKKESDQTFSNIGEVNKRIQAQNRESMTVERRIVSLRSEISSLESEISSVENLLERKQRELARTFSDDYYRIQRLNQEIASLASRLDSLRARLTSKISDLNQQISRLRDIGEKIAHLTRVKKEMVELQREKARRRRESLRRRKKVEKETEKKASTKAESIQQTNENKIEQELNILRNILASVEVQFDTITDEFEMMIDYGVREEFSRKSEPLFSEMLYIMSRVASISQILMGIDQRTQKVMELRDQYYLSAEFTGEKGDTFRKSGFFCFPMWVVKVREVSTGMDRLEVIPPVSLSFDEVSVFTNDLNMSVRTNEIYSQEIVKKMEGLISKYGEVIFGADMMRYERRVERAASVLDKCVSDGKISSRAGRWAKLMLEV